MDSKIYTDMMEAYKEVYAPKEETVIEELIIELCNEFNAFETLEEMAEFAVDVVESDTTLEFLSLLAEELEVDITESLSESAETLEEKAALVRGLINALSKAGRNKALKTTVNTALGKKGNVIKGAAVAPTVRAARKARGATTAVTRAPGGPLAAAQTKKAADVSKATKQLPGSGGTSAGSLKARVQRGNRRDALAKNQVNVFMQGLKNMLTPAKKSAAGAIVKKPAKIATPKATGGLLGTRKVPTMKDLGAAPEPAWLKGTGAKLPKPPRDPRGRALVKTTGSNIQTPPGALTKTTGSKIQTPPIEKVRVKDLGPTARSTVSKGGKTLKGDGVIDVTATSTKTTGQKFKDLASKIGRNKGKLGAAVLGGAALTGMLSGDENTKTADGYGGTFKDATAKADPTKTGELNLPKTPAPKAPKTKTPAPKAPETKTPAPKADTAPTKTPTVLADKTPSKKRSSIADEIARLRKMRLASKMRQKGDDVKGADISDKQLDDAIKTGRLETRKSVREAYDSIYEKKCVDKKDKGMHNCAKKVCHEEYGEGETIFGQHAVPDENGFVSHYNVQFEHGIVENVSVEELEIITEGHHPEHVEHEGDLVEDGAYIPSRIDDFNSDSDRLRRMGKPHGPKIPSPGGGGQYDKPPRYRTGVMRLAKGKKTTQVAHFEPEGELVDESLPAKDQKERIERNVNEDVDVFDIIKGYLIDEGYADSEESALAIMANMTEEQRTEIIEGCK